jgi:hypothetical protein
VFLKPLLWVDFLLVAMKFSYIKVIDFPKHQLRERFLPWIRLGIFNPKKETERIYPLGLVDSGASITIINHEIGEELGFDIKKVKRGLKGQVVGVGGGKIDVFFHKVGFFIHNGSKKKPIIYEDFVGFTYRQFPSSMPQQTAILGRIGFFNHLKVGFIHPEWHIDITKYNT